MIDDETEINEYARAAGISVDKARSILFQPPTLDQIEEQSDRLVAKAEAIRAKAIEMARPTLLSLVRRKLSALGR